MSYDNRLSAEQTATLTPGDTVHIETWGPWRDAEVTTGTVVRLTATQVIVSRRSRSSGDYEDRFRRKDAKVVGGGSRAELVDPTHPRTVADLAGTNRRRRQSSIDALVHRWTRNRDNLDALRELHTAIGEYLDAEAEQ